MPPTPTATPHPVPAVPSVRVWAVTGTTPTSAGRLEPLLAPAERCRLGRYRDPKARAEHVVGRVALRLLVADHLGVDPASVELRTGRRARPALTTDTSMGLGIAHTDGLVVVALHPTLHLGVDVEPRDRAVPDRVVQRACTAAELAWLATLPDDQRPAAFLALWVRKEAVGKADGRGIGVGPGQLEVRSNPVVVPPPPGSAAPGSAAPGAPLPELHERASRWWVRDLELGAGHLGAIAVPAADVTLRVEPRAIAELTAAPGPGHSQRSRPTPPRG